MLYETSLNDFEMAREDVRSMLFDLCWNLKSSNPELPDASDAV